MGVVMKVFISLILGFFLVALLAVAYKNEIDFRDNCHAKGGVVVEANELMCVNKEAIIK